MDMFKWIGVGTTGRKERAGSYLQEPLRHKELAYLTNSLRGELIVPGKQLAALSSCSISLNQLV